MAKTNTIIRTVSRRTPPAAGAPMIKILFNKLSFDPSSAENIHRKIGYFLFGGKVVFKE